MRRDGAPTHRRPQSRSYAWAPAPRKRVMAAVVAFAVFVGASVFAWDLSHVDGPPPDGSGSVDPWTSLPVGWSELPPPPEVRTGTATGWTGSQMLVWGGYEYTGYGDEASQNDGFVYDASSRTWSPIAAGPLDGRSDPAFAWTGDELLIWGGRFEGGGARLRSSQTERRTIPRRGRGVRCLRPRSTAGRRSPCGPARSSSCGGAPTGPPDAWTVPRTIRRPIVGDRSPRALWTSRTGRRSGPETRCSWSGPHSMATTTRRLGP